jgi:glycosyltransferase involved in cell wall biosynthesis
MSNRNGNCGPPPAGAVLDDDGRYAMACAQAIAGDLGGAIRLFEDVLADLTANADRAVLENDLAVVRAVNGELSVAREQFETALDMDSGCSAARENLAVLDEVGWALPTSSTGGGGHSPPYDSTGTRPARVAILSLLFNWPSTGGGTVHTAELGKFLGRADYEVQHIYAPYPDWGLGIVTEPTGVRSVALVFDPSNWNAASIQRRFREAVDAFAPDYVIITDTWNSKPLLAEAVRGYRYFLRLAAMECLCPLNNVRLLVDAQGQISACPRQQLATPHVCRECVASRGHQSGGLHQAERELSGFGSAEYSERLLRAFAEAEGVLVVNPLIAAMVAPFANAVHVIPSGFDPERFPFVVPPSGGGLGRPIESAATSAPPLSPPADVGKFVPSPPAGRVGVGARARLLFAGLVTEYMKGFHVLHAACEKLWQKRQDFELLATADPPRGVGFQPAASEQLDEFTRFVGWLSQEKLPDEMRRADILVFPTIAEEALGRTAVEAMGAARPVIASRIGGLQFTVTDGLTGLLAEPGDVDDLAAKIETLLDQPEMRRRMGEAGRRKFEQEFTWDVIIARHYKRLMPGVLFEHDGVHRPSTWQVGNLPHGNEETLCQSSASR